MDLEESTCLTSGSTTKPQSSRQYGTDNKDRNIDQWNKTESPEINSCTYDTLSLTKEAKAYNGEKTIFLSIGAGETCQPHAKG